MIRNKKVVFFLIILIVIAAVVLLVQIFTSSGNPPSSTPVPSLNPTKLEVLSPKSSSEVASVTEIIRVKFNQPIDEKSLQFELLPKNEIKINLDDSKSILTIEPTNAWNFNTNYFVKILKVTKSASGQEMDQDYTYSFKTAPYSGI